MIYVMTLIWAPSSTQASSFSFSLALKAFIIGICSFVFTNIVRITLNRCNPKRAITIVENDESATLKEVVGSRAEIENICGKSGVGDL